MSWEQAFVAASLALGQDLDDSLAALDDEGRVRVGRLAAALREAPRARRAKLLAKTLLAVGADLERMRLG